jgi:hypothetical protein
VTLDDWRCVAPVIISTNVRFGTVCIAVSHFGELVHAPNEVSSRQRAAVSQAR